MIELLANPNAWAALATLTAMEIVLGIDNVVFISILVSKLPQERAKIARQVGLALALVFRILFLFTLTWLMGLTSTLFVVMDQPINWRDLILVAGGLFLLVKGTTEIHSGIEGDEHSGGAAATAAFAMIVGQIIVIDLVFSVDSIVTAIGMAEDIEIMVAAVMIAVGVMYAASGPVSEFIQRHPTTKMLALSFLLLIGVALVADGLGFHIPRGYIYFAMAFSAGVETINVFARRNQVARQRTK